MTNMKIQNDRSELPKFDLVNYRGLLKKGPKTSSKLLYSPYFLLSTEIGDPVFSIAYQMHFAHQTNPFR